MPEGHSIRIQADYWDRILGKALTVSSPQGRFEEEADTLTGTSLLASEAHGKHLFLQFKPDLWLHIHLGLYGKFKWQRSKEVAAPKGAVRMRAQWDGGVVDLIGPTRCELLDTAGKDKIHARLGPDPLHPDDTLEPMMAWLNKSEWPIGRVLMDQSKIAGIGNVYRAEILFMLAMDPWRQTKDLSSEEWEKLWTLSRQLLTAGVEDRRIITTRKDLPPPATLPPNTHCASKTYTYKREGKACVSCGTTIRAEAFHSRTLYWCPTCQAPNA